MVAPGAKPDRIRMRIMGSTGIHLDSEGNLEVDADGNAISLQKPTIYQGFDGGRHIVSGGYVVTNKNEIAFQVGDYDSSRALIIDPVLVLSTYLGGGDQEDTFPSGVAVDPQGNIYVAGSTSSTDFPLQKPLQSIPSPAICGTAPNAFRCGTGFISKFDPTATTLLYSTYFGGTGQLNGVTSVAVDSLGNVFVAGATDSSDFPTTLGALSTAYVNGPGPCPCPFYSNDACPEVSIAKLDPAGSKLLYSTYLVDVGSSIASWGSLAIDNAGNAFVTGSTNSVTFPTTPGAFQTSCAPLTSTTTPKFCASTNIFVAKLNPSGAALVYSTYLGGSGLQQSGPIAIDAFGSAYLTGITTSLDFPLMNPLQAAVAGAFVTKLKPDGSGLVYSTYLGPKNSSLINYQTLPNAIAVDLAGAVYLAGATNVGVPGNFFPTTPGSFQSSINVSGTPGFVAKIDPTGTFLEYSTFLSGTNTSSPIMSILGIAIDPLGHAYVTGYTNESDFPLLNPLQSFGGGTCTPPNGNGACYDTFVTGLNSSGTALIFSTYLGGSSNDEGSSLAVDHASAVYAVGLTSSTNFPTVNAFQPTYGGGTSCPNGLCYDAYLAKIQPPAPSALPSTLSFSSRNTGSTSPAQAVILANPGTQALSIMSLATSGDFSQTNNCGSSVPANSSCTINVTFLSTMLGQRSGVLTVLHDGAGGPLTVSLTGSGLTPIVTFSANNLTFNSQLVGTTSTAQAVALMNSATGPLTISSVMAGGDFAVSDNCAGTLAASAGCSLSVTFTPSASGTRTGAVSISDNASGSPQTISLSGSGANFSFTSASGSSASATITAGQRATYQLSLSPQSFSGAVNVICSEPTPIPQTTCAVSPTQAVLSGSTAVPVTVTLTTMAQSGVFTPIRELRFPHVTLHELGTLRWLFFLMLLLAMSVAANKSRKRVPLAIAAFFILALVATGCGSMGYSGGGTGGSTGTPAGTYQLVVSASASGVTRSMTLSVTVQ